MIFFYESLHHAVQPWLTLKHVSRFLKPDGKVAFAGEPINNDWWKHWGLRLDSLSVYCIHKFGWFENGWSETFLKSCFEQAGLTLKVFPYIGLNGTHIGVAASEASRLSTDKAMEDLIELGTIQHQYHKLNQMYDQSINKHNQVVNSLLYKENLYKENLVELSTIQHQYYELSQKYDQVINSRLYKTVVVPLRSIIHNIRRLYK